MPKKTVKTKKASKKTRVTKTAQKATKKSKKTKKVAQVAPPVAPPVTPAPPAPPAAPPVVPAKTEAEKIWDEIKYLPIQMFGLPDQFVSQHCTFVPVEPSQLYLTIRSTATLPSLEAAVGPGFLVDLADKFVIVKRAAKQVIPSKK